MLLIILFVALVVMMLTSKFWMPSYWGTGLKFAANAGLGIFASLILASTSFVTVGSDSVGHLKKIYGSADLPEGSIIAVNGEKGPQAEILPPGFHIRPFIRIIYDFEEFPVVNIPEGKLGVVTAIDGDPLEGGQFLARPWSQEQVNHMMDAYTFLTGKAQNRETGTYDIDIGVNGQKGTQLTYLPPGDYRFNHYLFSVKTVNATKVERGEVAVIKSNVQTRESCPAPMTDSETGGMLATPLVPVGCIGVWDEPYLPGRYYLNPEAYEVTMIPTTVQAWEYRGDYKTRSINLTVNDDGSITQTASGDINVDMPAGAADGSIIVTTEGWRVPIDVRMMVQVDPANAPRVVASVGGLDAVENNVGTPSIRSVLRNLAGAENQKVLALIHQREKFENMSEQELSPELAKAGVTLKEIRLGDPVLPPELLITRKREQLAQQLKTTYEQEKIAQKERIAAEREKAIADQQPKLVEAQIAKEAAVQAREMRRLQGEGERLYLEEVARGQKAQVAVLGAEATERLKGLEMVLTAVQANPEMVKVPAVNVAGGNTGEGSAAVLGTLLGGGSNVASLVKAVQTTQATKQTEERQ